MRGYVASYETKQGKRWRVLYSVPDPETGKRRQRQRRGFTRERDAHKWLREALGRVDQGVITPPSAQTFAVYARQWLETISVGPNTLSQYRQALDAYAIPGHCPECAIGGVKLAALTPQNLDKLYRHLEQDGRKRKLKDKPPGLSPKMVRIVHTPIRRMLKEAVERGDVPRNVADLAHPPPQKAARSTAARERCWTPEQTRKFLNKVSNDRLAAAWLLFAITGMRRGEVLGLTWDKVDLRAGRLTVAGIVTVTDNRVRRSPRAKTEAGERTFSLDKATVAALKAHRKQMLGERMLAGEAWTDTGLVFTQPDGALIHPERLSGAFKRHCGKAGLPHIGIHGLRHSYCTAALRAGVSPEVVQQRVGHSDIAVTLGIYAHVRREDDERAARTAAEWILGR